LLTAAEESNFDVLVTTDQNLRYQQDLRQRQFGVVVLSTTSWPRIRKALPMVSDALEGMTPGAYLEVRIP
jgi:hypothetical protein